MQVSNLPPLVAVIVAVPSPTAVSVACAASNMVSSVSSTLTILGSLDDHEIFFALPTSLAGATTAVSFAV